LAVSSIPMAKKYYYEFKKQLTEAHKNLTIATIFSYSQNEDDIEDIAADESFDTEKLDMTSREFLKEVIADYNTTFSTNFDTSSDKFQNYYKDLSLKMKQRQVDLLIVVNMFLTGFDATTLNTLWVDKNLKYHGLIQAFSRTNRILNSVKTFGNIVCFRDLQKETDDAISMFANKNTGGIVLLRSFDDYYNGYDEEKEDGSKKHNVGYVDLINELLTLFPLGQQIIGEQNEKNFIALYGTILRMRNILTSFDDFKGKELLTDGQLQDYQSKYIDLKEKYKQKAGEKENINDDIVFETELIRQVEVNIDYILLLVEKYRASNCANKEILVKISKAINSSIELRSKKELIEGFIEKVNVSSSVSDDWKEYVQMRREEDLSALIENENLKPELARQFIYRSFQDGEIRTIGEELQSILPNTDLFDEDSNKKNETIIDKIKAFFEKYIGLIV
ncbi:MAG: type I restriction endonuclease subunit R, partial [Desulfovibrio sp.]|nr:type I restriction endonuclease subunit R [Desulfovibrio sp.]